jgi:hypothetical protein
MYTNPTLLRTVTNRKPVSYFLALLAVFSCASAAFAQVCSIEEARAKCCSMSCCKTSVKTVQAPCCCSREQPGDITTTTFLAPERAVVLIAAKPACPANIEAFAQRAAVSSIKYWRSNHRAHAPPVELYLLHRALLI